VESAGREFGARWIASHKSRGGLALVQAMQMVWMWQIVGHMSSEVDVGLTPVSVRCVTSYH
jgi:hypothetical protein